MPSFSRSTFVQIGFYLQSYLLFGFLLLSTLAWGREEHQLLRRVVVFPIQSEAYNASVTEEAWWQIREELTQNKRFLVASKNFLVKKDVYQSRGELTPADAIILGQLLDAHALVTTFIKQRRLFMRVYEGHYGRLLWEQDLRLHPSIHVVEQLPGAGKRLIRDFMASIPYQGFVIVDSLVGQPVEHNDGKVFVKVNVGEKSKAEVGDLVQFVKVESDRLQPLFTEGAAIKVFAEGRLVSLQRELGRVELTRVTDVKEIKEGTLVRLPKELKRLQAEFKIRENLAAKISPTYLHPEMGPVEQETAEYKPLVNSLGSIVNLAVLLLLAF